jgi:hypothetical protein
VAIGQAAPGSSLLRQGDGGPDRPLAITELFDRLPLGPLVPHPAPTRKLRPRISHKREPELELLVAKVHTSCSSSGCRIQGAWPRLPTVSRPKGQGPEPAGKMEWQAFGLEWETVLQWGDAADGRAIA